MNNYFALGLIFLNLLLIYYYNKKKIKNLFFKQKIKSVDLVEVNEIFLPSKNIKFKFPKEEVVIKNFFINPSFQVVGMMSDYEGWILSCLAKSSKNIFEFGTCSGKTTALLALNSSAESKVFSVTLNPADLSNLSLGNNQDVKAALNNAIKESIYDQFIFTNMSIKNKINLIFEDSNRLNVDKFENLMDLIFIDGGHNYSCVKNDSEKSFRMIKNEGYIFWHDYNVSKRSCKDVVKYIHEISKIKKIFHIKNTALCYYKNSNY
jgi:predicted O-methyltransferase YrrM